jgi:hypothetical protein
MIIFQLHVRRERDLQLPRDFFNDTLPVFSTPARELIRAVDQNCPNLSRENRNRLIEIIGYAIPKNHTYIDDRIPVERPPSREEVNRTIQELKSFTLKLDRGEITTQTIETMLRLNQCGEFSLRSLVHLIRPYNADQNFREFIDRVTTDVIIRARNPMLVIQIEEMVEVAQRMTQQSENEVYRLMGQLIQRAAPQNQGEIGIRAMSTFHQNSIEGLRFLEYNTRNSQHSELDLIEVHGIYRQTQQFFTFERAQNMLSLIRGIRNFEQEINHNANARWGNDAGFDVYRTRFQFSDAILRGEMNFGQLTVRAMQTMNDLGLNHNNREILFNFIYAISTIGEVATRELHNRTGIIHFARYSRHTLEEVLSNVTNPNRDQRPVAVLIMNRDADWNGAFYQKSRQIETLTRGYRLVIIEDSNDQEALRRTIEVATRLGPIRAIGFGGHGNAQSIQIGPDRNNPNNLIDLSDTNNMGLLLDQHILTQDAVIFLIACRTGDRRGGRPIGQEISDSLSGRRLFAPDRSTALDHFEFDDNGIIVGVEYTDRGSQQLFQREAIPRRNR